MKLEIGGPFIVEASAERVWQILAHEYEHIGRWASAISHSVAVEAAEGAPDGAPICGRVCGNSVAGFGDITETFTYYDEATMRFGYAATEGLPRFVKSATNNWSVRRLDDNHSEVTALGEIELPWFPGVLLAPLLKWQMGRLGQQTTEEFKYYVENGRPHPRKVKLLAKGEKVKETAVR